MVLGKISDCFIGKGGYQDIEFVAHFVLTTQEWDVQYYFSGGRFNSTRNDDHQTLCTKIISLMADAKVSRFEQLKGKPVQILMDKNTCVGFRILTEVL